MHKKVIEFNLSQRNNQKIPKNLRAGDVIRLHRKIKEGGKERIQIVEGIIIAVNGKQSSSPVITVRKVSFGIGVELMMPIYSPQVEKIELVRRATTRKSKLYYIRNRSNKSLRMKYQDIAAFTQEELKQNDSKEDIKQSDPVKSDEISDHGAGTKDTENNMERKDKNKKVRKEQKDQDKRKKEDNKEDNKEENEEEKEEESAIEPKKDGDKGEDIKEDVKNKDVDEEVAE